MGSWSPLRDPGRQQRQRMSRGRRRRHLAAARDDPDAVLTDLDAASAAQASRTARSIPGQPAWERFASAPARPRAQPGDGASDAVLAACHAEQAGSAGVMGHAVTPGRVSRAARDYGTGPAYNPAGMR